MSDAMYWSASDNSRNWQVGLQSEQKHWRVAELPIEKKFGPQFQVVCCSVAHSVQSPCYFSHGTAHRCHQLNTCSISFTYLTSGVYSQDGHMATACIADC